MSLLQGISIWKEKKSLILLIGTLLTVEKKLFVTNKDSVLCDLDKVTFYLSVGNSATLLLLYLPKKKVLFLHAVDSHVMEIPVS